jgi:radical SAM protein with 4Fe4S-binding SPASM domain
LDNFCIVPWIHLNTEPNGAIKPCCAFSPENGRDWGMLQDHTLEQVWNSESQKNLRKEFLNNNQPKGCDTCFKREASGGHSMRMRMNENFASHIEDAKKNTKDNGEYNKFNLIYWDFRFSNICNFKCRMCGPALSSSWWDDEPNTGQTVKYLNSEFYKTDLMKYVDQFIDNVEEIYFAGGEPLIMPEHYVILDKLIEKERFDVYLRYNTNLSTLKYKNYDLLNVWKKFDDVEIFASLDGIEENAEYTRFGTNWEKINDNLSILAELHTQKKHHITLYISPTIHILNVFHFPKLVDKVLSLGLSARQLVIGNLLWPTYLKIGLLPDHLKKKLGDIYTDHLQTVENEEDKMILTEKYKSIFYFLNETCLPNDQEKFIRQTLKYDKLRNEDIRQAVPELKDWINENLDNRS